jgi:hypothetical protein
VLSALPAKRTWSVRRSGPKSAGLEGGGFPRARPRHISYVKPGCRTSYYIGNFRCWCARPLVAVASLCPAITRTPDVVDLTQSPRRRG